MLKSPVTTDAISEGIRLKVNKYAFYLFKYDDGAYYVSVKANI